MFALSQRALCRQPRPDPSLSFVFPKQPNLTTPNVDHFLDKVKKQISVHSVRAAILHNVAYHRPLVEW